MALNIIILLYYEQFGVAAAAVFGIVAAVST